MSISQFQHAMCAHEPSVPWQEWRTRLSEIIIWITPQSLSLSPLNTIIIPCSACMLSAYWMIDVSHPDDLNKRRNKTYSWKSFTLHFCALRRKKAFATIKGTRHFWGYNSYKKMLIEEKFNPMSTTAAFFYVHYWSPWQASSSIKGLILA